MKPFQYQRCETVAEALHLIATQPTAAYIAGGTTVVDLLKLHVVTPDLLVDVRNLPLGDIEVDKRRIRIGATVRNSDLAWHPAIREHYPVLSEALLAGASTQLRNVATVAGNLLQRTRCSYFRDVDAACNKREPGSGCAALTGYNRGHAVLGGSGSCIAVAPSDAATALVILDAVVHTVRPDGTGRRVPFEDLHLLPGDTPDRETVLERGELITHVDLPGPPAVRRSTYLKVRDRSSYEFALASAAVALEINHGTIRSARVALGGIATKPWRSTEAERVLQGARPTDAVFRDSAEAALSGAEPHRYNGFKVELAKRTLIRALTDLATRPRRS
jgi:xanthine dehydrogenase YagS FAD-binding subunit